MTAVQNDPIYVLPFLYRVGMQLSNDATTPHTLIDVTPGQCRDSNDVMDITLGTANPNLAGETVATPFIVNSAINGYGGLDTGTVAVSTMYAFYAIADSRYYNPAGVIMTLASNSSPLMPFGYDSYRVIGYWATDSSGYFLKGYYSGSPYALTFTYDAPQATAITSGSSTTYANVNLISLVPNSNNMIVNVYTSYTPGTAGHTLKMQPGNATGDAITITGQVASVIVTTNSYLLAQPVVISTVSSPVINYKVVSGDTVAIDVAGFTTNL